MNRGILEKENILEQYNFGIINSKGEFLTVLKQLVNIGRTGSNNKLLFHDSLKRLLEYVHRTEDVDDAVLLTRLVYKVSKLINFSVAENASNLHQLCDLLMTQLKPKNEKIRVYNNVLKILNNSKGSMGSYNMDSVVAQRIGYFEGNIYECFNLKLSIELLHTYLVLNDKGELRHLFKDILVDWEHFEEQISERLFEKILWYGFILERDDKLQSKVKQYDSLIKSKRWGIKFYCYVKKIFSDNGRLNKEKLNYFIRRFKQLNSFSVTEKESIILNILKKMKEKQLTKSIIRLVSYNLPERVKLSEINQKLVINLAVYENKNTKKVKQIIQVEALSHPKRDEVYLSGPALKKVIDENKTGYIYIIEDYSKPKTDVHEWFKWPSTEITNSEDSTNGAIELSEKSELRNMGYQITGKTREQRWKVLQQAVPELGLKKVAYTIAGNVKLRKGQKNGLNKFSYAISEWEYDLGKLKKKYYRQEFNWPKT